jgi:SAM-dependent methyltransferase
VNSVRYTTPLQYAASLTADFARASAPHLSSKSTLLDVGCGDGLVAAELAKSGLNVLAIDGNEEAVGRAQAIAVNAQQSTLLDFEHAPFDLLLVSRALHHMPPLAETVKKLNSLLKPGGVLVIEEFGFELIDSASAGWLIAQTKKIKSGNTALEPKHKWLWNADNLNPEEACKLWLQQHWGKHQLLNSKEMKEALTEHTEVISCQENDYLFRYLCDFLAATGGGAAQAEEIRREECEMIRQGKLPAIGLRIVSRRK